MGSYPRCAPRSGRCGWGEGVVCVRVCLAEASVGLIGGCVQRAAGGWMAALHPHGSDAEDYERAPPCLHPRL